MTKSILCFLFCLLWMFPVVAAENNETDETTAEVAEAGGETAEAEISADLGNVIEYTHVADMPEMKEFDDSSADLYSGAEVQPLNIQISQEEKMQNLENDLDYIDSEYELPELLCSNEKLTKEVANFIKDNTDSDDGSVRSRRSKLLMVKNLHNFNEIKETDLDAKQNFKAKAALMYLRINESKEIYRICESKDNDFGQFSNIYLIIYPYFKYYKVVVTNLISIPEKMDKATFIHSW